MFLKAFPLEGEIMCVRRVSGGKTLAAWQTRQLDLLVSVQTTRLAARRVQAQRCKANERSQFLLVGIGMLKNTCGKMAPQRQPAPAADPSMVSRQPADVHATAAHELRILGR